MSISDGAGQAADPREATEVFISYSSQDRDKVEAIADAFIKAGFNVWWDRDLLPGDSYEDSIEVALNSAKAVIVCWSQASVHSEWVRSEADDARVNGKLCPVMIEDCSVPKPFDRVHTENIIGWRGNRDHHAFQELEEAVRARVEGRVAKKIPWKRKWLTRGALISVVAMVGVAAANVSLIKDIFFPQDVVTSQEVEDLVAAALAQALTNGVDLDERGQDGLRDALTSILASSNAEKAGARAALAEGRMSDAANSLADVARQQAAAAGEAVSAAAQTWREAGALYSASDTAKAIDAFEQALELVPTDPDAANGLAGLYERVGRLEEAQALYESILDNAGRTDPVWKAKALGNLGLMAVSRGQWDVAEGNVRQAMEIFEEQGDQESVAKALVNLGQINQETGDMDQSRSYSKRGLALARQLKMPKGEATALANLGYVDMLEDDFDGARDYFQQASEIMEAQGMKTELGMIYINQTRILSIENKMPEAEAMARQALVVAREMDSRIVEAGAYNHLGNIARDRGDLDEADRYQQMAIQIFDGLDNPAQLARQYQAWGMTAEARDDLPEAIKRYEQSLDVLNRIDAPSRQGNVLLTLARVSGRAGNMEKAAAYLDEAQPRFETAEDYIGLGDLMDIRAMVSLANGDLQNAINSYEKASNAFLTAGEPTPAAHSLVRIADIALRANEPSIAAAAAGEAITLMPADAPIELQSEASVAAAEAALGLGDPARAVEVVAALVTRADASGEVWPRANARLIMARIHRSQNQQTEARDNFTAAADILRDAGGEFTDIAAQVEAERDQ